VLACAGLNLACFLLSFPALALCAFYSYTKRFTWLCHFVLGLVLGLAPLAGWLAVRPSLALPAFLFLLGVTFWVAGFDILYACQDTAFDRARGLHSLPADFGVPAALALSAFCHVNTGIFFLLAGWAAWLAWPYYLVWALATAILVWEHTLVSAEDMSRVNLAFFTANGAISVALFLGALFAVYA
jgi:4-hydroxybenzoate polyprenyltransferase